MLCKFVEKNISAYLDGETGRLSSYIIERHLASCPGCKKKLELLRAVSGLVKEKTELALSPEFMENLRRKVETVKIQTPVLKPVISFKLGLSAFSLLLVLAG